MDPYSTINAVNENYIHFKRMNQLNPHELLKFVDIKPTNHPSYGNGYMAFLTDRLNIKYKVQLPGKYLKQLKLPHHINMLLDDIKASRNPYLVYRCQLEDSSYVMEVVKFDADVAYKYSKGIPYPQTSPGDASSSVSTDTSTTKAPTKRKYSSSDEEEPQSKISG